MISRTSWESWTLKGKLHKEQLRKSCILAQNHANGAHSSVFSWRIASETSEPSCSNANEGDASMNSVIPGASKGDRGDGEGAQEGAGGGRRKKERKKKKGVGGGGLEKEKEGREVELWSICAKPLKNKISQVEMEGTKWTALQFYPFKIWESLRNKLGWETENFLNYLPVGLKPKLKLGAKMLY